MQSDCKLLERGLDSLRADEDWFVWMSFPDPHHPWDPPASETKRVPWRELDLPPGHPGTNEKIALILAQKPRHWLAWWEGRLIDEACGRVLRRIAERGGEADTDVFFTTDHGELQGDFGLLYKGPYHVEALMRIPFLWRPAPSAGVPVADWMQGEPLPTAPGSGRERVITDLRDDPLQWRNLWSEPAWQRKKRELIAELREYLPPPRNPALRVEAPA